MNEIDAGARSNVILMAAWSKPGHAIDAPGRYRPSPRLSFHPKVEDGHGHNLQVRKMERNGYFVLEGRSRVVRWCPSRLLTQKRDRLGARSPKRALRKARRAADEDRA